jgi:hypothetical protein
LHSTLLKEAGVIQIGISVCLSTEPSSLQEVDAVLKVGIQLDYIDDSDYQHVAPLIEKEYFKLVAFDKTLRKDSTKRRRYT